MSSAPILNPEQLEQLSEIERDSPGFIAEIMDLFRSESSTLFAAMRSNL
jgi:hypothetical protein